MYYICCLIPIRAYTLTAYDYTSFSIHIHVCNPIRPPHPYIVGNASGFRRHSGSQLVGYFVVQYRRQRWRIALFYRHSTDLMEGKTCIKMNIYSSVNNKLKYF